MYADCARCGQRFESEIKDLTNPICENCKVLHGENLPKLIELLKKKNIPGHEPILRAIDLLFKRVQQLEYDQIPKEKIQTK